MPAEYLNVTDPNAYQSLRKMSTSPRSLKTKKSQPESLHLPNLSYIDADHTSKLPILQEMPEEQLGT